MPLKQILSIIIFNDNYSKEPNVPPVTHKKVWLSYLYILSTANQKMLPTNNLNLSFSVEMS